MDLSQDQQDGIDLINELNKKLLRNEIFIPVRADIRASVSFILLNTQESINNANNRLINSCSNPKTGL